MIIWTTPTIQSSHQKIDGNSILSVTMEHGTFLNSHGTLGTKGTNCLSHAVPGTTVLLYVHEVISSP